MAGSVHHVNSLRRSHGLDAEPFTCRVTHPEVPGEYYFTPLASLITSAARLMLALLEDCVAEAGGTYAMEDTDSMAIVATEDGGLVPCRGEPVTLYRVHGANTPSDDLYRGTLGVTAKHLAGTSGRARQALLERRVDALWSLGEFGRARREAFAAALSEPALLGHPRFVKRLLSLAAPTRVLKARR